MNQDPEFKLYQASLRANSIEIESIQTAQPAPALENALLNDLESTRSLNEEILVDVNPSIDLNENSWSFPDQTKKTTEVLDPDAEKERIINRIGEIANEAIKYTIKNTGKFV